MNIELIYQFGPQYRINLQNKNYKWDICYIFWFKMSYIICFYFIPLWSVEITCYDLRISAAIPLLKIVLSSLYSSVFYL